MAASQADDLGGLECPVCRDMYNDPRVLPCGHTFCLECIRQVAGYLPSLRCPECRAEYRLPLGGVGNFSKNVAILRQLEVRDKAETLARATFSVCPLCSEEEELKVCGHCDTDICFSCQNEHLPEYRKQVQTLAKRIHRQFDVAMEGDSGLSSVSEWVADKAKSGELVELFKKRGKFSPSKLSRIQEELEQIRQRFSAITGRPMPENTAISHVGDDRPGSTSPAPEPAPMPATPPSPTPTDSSTPAATSPSSMTSTPATARTPTATSTPAAISAPAVILAPVPATAPSSVPVSSPSSTIRLSRTATSQSSYHHAWLEPFTSSVLDKDLSRVKLRFGTCGSFPGQFSNPQALAIDKYNGDIIVVDEDNHRIQVFQASGKLRLCFGSRASGAYEFSHPKGLAINEHGQMIISDQYNHRLKIHNRDGTLERVIGSRGFTNGLFNHPAGIAIDRRQNIHVCDQLNGRIQMLTQQGQYIWQYEPQPSWQVRHISISTRGVICLSDDVTCMILDENYQPLERWNVPGNISGLCVYEETFVLVSDCSGHRILLYSLRGDLLKTFDLAAAGQYREPRGLAVDRHGNINIACSAMIVKF